ncbi:hypothetical protein [Alkalimarinus coralli]|uniref:hypothetical protein n=1 Tax=Alkalimarinus coralli TaxID=2935863 RepID=UPI00202AF0A6|nr:hypothetical protein [Alkalimarinus coralli]
MKTRLTSYLFISLLFLIEGCSSISSSTTQSATIAFGGYYFVVPPSPDFVGANSSDSLIISFNDHSKKVVFSLNNYQNFDDYNISAAEFLSVVYGSTATKNKSLNMLKQSVAENELSREKFELNNLVVYRLTYQAKEFSVIYNKARPLFWVAIESSGIDMLEVVKSLKEI